MRSMSDALNRGIQQLAESPHLSELYYVGIHDVESLKGADLVRFSALINQFFRICEEMYYQQLEGHLDPRLWRGFEAIMHDIIGYTGVQAWWRLRSHWFSEEFVKFINQLQQTAKPARLYREPMGDEG